MLELFVFNEAMEHVIRLSSIATGFRQTDSTDMLRASDIKPYCIGIIEYGRLYGFYELEKALNNSKRFYQENK